MFIGVFWVVDSKFALKKLDYRMEMGEKAHLRLFGVLHYHECRADIKNPLYISLTTNMKNLDMYSFRN